MDLLPAPLPEGMDSVVPQTRAGTSRSETQAPLHVLQEHVPSLAGKRAKQLLQIVPCPVESAKGATDERRDTPEVIQVLLKRAHATVGIANPQESGRACAAWWSRPPC